MADTTNRVKRKVVVSDTVRWTCPTCKKTVLTAYCAQCGEKPHSQQEYSFRSIAEKLAHALTSVDARVVRTAWCLLRHPGRLTLAWTAGAHAVPDHALWHLTELGAIIAVTTQSMNVRMLNGCVGRLAYSTAGPMRIKPMTWHARPRRCQG
jgi:hypothetical protein